MAVNTRTLPNIFPVKSMAMAVASILKAHGTWDITTIGNDYASVMVITWFGKTTIYAEDPHGNLSLERCTHVPPDATLKSIQSMAAKELTRSMLTYL